MQNILGIDVGYGFSKCYDGEKVYSFPTSVSNSYKPGGFNSPVPVEVDNVRYYIGDDVSEKWYDPRRASFLGSPDWCALIAHCIRLTKIPNLFKSVIVMGIPAGYFNKQKVNELIYLLRNKYISGGNGRMAFDEAQIYFVPQGFGIFLKYINDNKLNNIFTNKTYSVVDLGFHTLDMISLRKGRYVTQDARTEPIGISSLLDEVAREFSQKYGFTLTRDKAIELVQTGKVEYAGDELKLPALDGVLNIYCRSISNTVNGYMEKTMPDLCIAGGGGVYILKGHDFKLTQSIRLVQDPAGAQCMGYRQYGVDKNAGQ
jgi:plasmid segregation protein ParM